MCLYNPSVRCVFQLEEMMHHRSILSKVHPRERTTVVFENGSGFRKAFVRAHMLTANPIADQTGGDISYGTES